MLVLSRKVEDTIIIGDSVKIKVVQIKGNRIRLGIEAPSDVKILRGELAPYDIASDQKTDSEKESLSASRQRFENSAPAIEFEITPEELRSLPNPFAHAS